MERSTNQSRSVVKKGVRGRLGQRQLHFIQLSPLVQTRLSASLRQPFLHRSLGLLQ